MQYRKATIAKGSGFANPPELDARLLDHTAFQVLGYGEFISWGDIEPDTLAFTQKYWEPANELFTLLANGQYVEALKALRQGPWSPHVLPELLIDLDLWALALSPERQELGAMSAQILDLLRRHGMETYHGALRQRHLASFEAAESLQDLLETEMGAEMVDTGALYDREGNMEGARDLVMQLRNGAEIALRVYHDPRQVKYEGAIPERMQKLIESWVRCSPALHT